MKKKRKADSENRDDDWEQRLESFLSSPLALRASQGLSDRISVALHLEGKDFFFGRKDGVNTLSRVETESSDVHFWMNLTVLRHLLAMAEQPDTGIAAFGITIFEHIFTQDEQKKIKFRVDSGFLTLWSKGYFSVLKAGGPEVASYLARFGFNGLNAIKEILKRSGVSR